MPALVTATLSPLQVISFREHYSTFQSYALIKIVVQSLYQIVFHDLSKLGEGGVVGYSDLGVPTTLFMLSGFTELRYE